MTYNYEHFDDCVADGSEAREFAALSDHLHVGGPTPQSHDSFDSKLANARMLRDEIGVRRTILVDDLDGTAHRAYGLLPNMTSVQLEFRDVDRDAFYQRLRRNGDRAYEELKRAEQIWQRRG